MQRSFIDTSKRMGVIMVRQCKSDFLESCIDDGSGKCTGCGVFMKGNKHGENSHRRDAVKNAIKGALKPKDVEALVQKLAASKNENVQIKLLALYLDRILGKAITPIVSHKDKEESDVVEDKVKEMLDSLLDR